MNVPFVDLSLQNHSLLEEITHSIQTVIANNSFINGPDVTVFENNFAKFCGAPYAIGCSSGTAALKLALLACNIQPGDEVITTPHTFIATIEAIIAVGAKPVFVDINEHTYNLDDTQIEAKITSKTKAILPVHLYGQPVNMKTICELASIYKLKVIADAAQAHGAYFHEKSIALWGDAVCFSFYPGKNLGALGDAGAVVTQDEHLAKKIRQLKDHGRQSKYKHDMIGFNDRMDSLQAAVLNVKLKKLPEWNKQRADTAKKYHEFICSNFIKLPGSLSGSTSVHHLFVIRSKHRDALQKKLKSQNIHTNIHYPIPLHLQPACHSLGYKRNDFPIAEKIANSVLSLPLFPGMTIEEIKYVSKFVNIYAEMLSLQEVHT